MALQGKIPDAVILPQDVKKNNGVVFSCITIQENGVNVSPCIDTAGLYYECQNGGMDMEGAANSVMGFYRKLKPERDFDVSAFMDYSKIRDRLSGRLINTDKNKIRLNELPHRDFFDLSLTYFVDVTMYGDDQERASIQVTNSHMEMWGVTEEELYGQFRDNFERTDSSRIMKVADIIPESEVTLPDGTKVGGGIPDIQMYVLTNSKELDGAVEILRKDALDKAACICGGDFYILPSSIHETTLIPADGEEGMAGNFANMVNEINATQVQEMEILSNHVYRYRSQTRKIEIAA